MRQYVLVAGVNYQNFKMKLGQYCAARMQLLLRKGQEDKVFHIFDFRTGEIVKHEFAVVNGRRLDKVTRVAQRAPIQPSNYDTYVAGGETRYRFKNGQTGALSILDVYQTLRSIGTTAPGTLMEFSVFSHAWLGGPVLVNSYDNGQIDLTLPGRAVQIPLPEGSRDPDDMDPRRKDFDDPIMTDPDRTALRAAFHKDGYGWIWGCNFTRPAHEILHKIEHHPRYRSQGVSDATVFRFTNLRAEHITWLQHVFQHIRPPFPDPRNVDIEFRHLKLFFRTITAASYIHKLAKTANVRVYGGLGGTYSEYEPGGLYRITGFARHNQFYKNYLGFRFDPEGRNYGEYLPTFSIY